jgi:uncharacterized membrane protein
MILGYILVLICSYEISHISEDMKIIKYNYFQIKMGTNTLDYHTEQVNVQDEIAEE